MYLYLTVLNGGLTIENLYFPVFGEGKCVWYLNLEPL